jgi:AraC-like DNA-binding protein
LGETFVELARYFRIAGLTGLEIMSARWVEHSFAPHVHDFYAVSLNHAGRGAFHCRKVRQDATPGTCNLIEPGEIHTGFATSSDGWSYRNLYIDTTLMSTLLEGIEWRGNFDVGFKTPLADDSILAARLTDVFDSLDEDVSISLVRSESALMAVVARLATHHLADAQSIREPGIEQKAVRRVKGWLDAHPERNISLQSLADLAGLSPFYLVRVFHKQIGIPPHQYQTNVRVLRARGLLRSGVPIAEAASIAGFCDQSHLNRRFKGTLGTTPGKYVRGNIQ